VKPESANNCTDSTNSSTSVTTSGNSTTATASTGLMNSSYLKSSTCTSPDNSSIENACTNKEIDQL
jgi:hypothetical protein